jgi:hypothetical protein
VIVHETSEACFLFTGFARQVNVARRKTLRPSIHAEAPGKKKPPS